MKNEMIEIPVREFWMGESENDKFATDTERPRHLVRFSHRFALGRTPITVDQFRAFRPEHSPRQPGEFPVVDVTPREAEAFCAWLFEKTSQPFRLPTEAEWEVACRSGAPTCFSTGDDIDLEHANFLYGETGEALGRGQRTPVATYPENSYGLADLHGNVCEITADHWHPDYQQAPNDGSAWLSSDVRSPRVIRGGAWDHLPRLLRSAWRDFIGLDEHRDNVGFRLALTLA